MKKILITGAGGYIGSIAVYLFLQKGFEVVAVDNFVTGFKEPLALLGKKFGNTQFRFYNADITGEMSQLFQKERGINGVIHYSASCDVNESMINPQKFFYNNVFGSLNLLNAMIAAKVSTLIFSSTCAVYGKPKSVPLDEEHETKPTHPYGESKLMAETIIRWYGKIFGLKYVILRYFNVTGATDDGLIGDSKKPSTLLTQNAVRAALGIAPFYLECSEVKTPDKTPIRDFINVIDLNEAHLLSLKYLLSGGKSDVINLGTGQGNSVLEIISKVQKITRKSFPVKKKPSRQGEHPKVTASIKKAKKILGWKPKRSIEKSIESLIVWYRNHPKG